MKLISWNVNGLRACMGKGFLDFLKASDADIVCLQETKMQREQADFIIDGYEEYWNSAEKKGYSGTAVFTKKPPLSVSYGIGIPEHDAEGRVITAEFPDFFLVNVYTPNSQQELARLPYRMQWEDAFRDYLKTLDQKKPHAREKNAGWRIDYFLVSDRLKDRVSDSRIDTDVFGSDHCPIELILKESD